MAVRYARLGPVNSYDCLMKAAAVRSWVLSFGVVPALLLAMYAVDARFGGKIQPGGQEGRLAKRAISTRLEMPVGPRRFQLPRIF